MRLPYTHFVGKKWRWIPGPGGIFERMVRSVKTALLHVMDKSVSDEELQTALAVAEAFMNSRPISYISTDQEGLEALTPSHFLLGHAWRDMAPIPDKWPLSRKFFALQKRLDAIWMRFMQEVVPQLGRFNTWTREHPSLQIGDVVAVLEEKDRGHWPIGRIIKVFKSEKDGKVRSVEVQFKGRILQRPITKLMLLLNQ
jgi:hypothetical protein